jgi:tetratricopeptide (TPR) repeat protein
LDAPNNLGGVYIEQKKFDLADSLYRSALKLYPDAPWLYCNLGLVEVERGQSKSALSTLNHALELDPSDPFAYKHRAMGYFKLARVSEVCADLRTANELGYSKYYDNEVNEMPNKNCQ